MTDIQALERMLRKLEVDMENASQERELRKYEPGDEFRFGIVQGLSLAISRNMQQIEDAKLGDKIRLTENELRAGR